MENGGRQSIFEQKNKTFLMFCFCFLFGVAIFSLHESDFLLGIFFYFSCFALVALFIFFWKNYFIRFILFGVAGFLLAGFVCWNFRPNFDKNFISFYNGQKVEFVGKIITEPEMTVEKITYTVQVEQLFLPARGRVFGKVLFTLPLYNKYNYGDKVRVKCALETPTNSPNSDFAYDKYLAMKNIYSTCSFAVTEKIEESRGIKSYLYFFKDKINEQTNKLFTEPSGSLLSGILYGAKSGLPKSLLTNFQRVGISHIIAVSGYNVSVIASVLSGLFLFLQISRKKAFWLAVGLICLFVIFSGGSASAVRAGIMGIIVLLSRQVGRSSEVGRLLIFSAVIMLLFNPKLLYYDAGFQLSFLAAIGLVYLSPLIEVCFLRWEKIKNSKILTALLSVISATTASLIFTLPLILYQFKLFSLSALPVNIMVLWLVPWIMLFGFLAIVISFVFYPLAQVLAWLTEAGLRYIIGLSNFVGEQSWSAMNLSISLSVMVLWYIILGTVLIKFRKI